MQRLAISTLLAALTLAPSYGQEKNLAQLPKHLTPLPYAGIRNYHITQNLGPTGARGWIYGHGQDTNESREILIKTIEPGSPADGILEPYDIIVGAATPPETPAATWTKAPALKLFDADARLSLARAITWAESDAGKGALTLLVARNGETKTVTITLPVMGTFADGDILECPKSQKIVRNAAEFLAKQMPADGYPEAVGEPHNAGLLLATHDPKYLDHVRRSAMRMSVLNTISDAGHETWRWGNTNTFLCEYYLATGDERVLPTIHEYAKVLQAGQCNPGTWGHSSVPDFVPPGYGSVNSTGIVCFLSLVLANQCGVHEGDKALANSIRFYGSYVGRGGIPYGDHAPYNASTSNGKNGAAAIAYHLLGADPAAQWYARLCASTNLLGFEDGHSGNYFNQTWSPLAASLSGKENYISFWKRFHSYRDLARRRDGSFIAQPMANKREGDLGTGNYVTAGPLWSTGSYALSYLAGSERLAILGRRDSVFAANPPEELKPALSHFRAKDFVAAADAANALIKSPTPRVAKLAAQLADISKRNLASIDLTIADMKSKLQSGDLYTLKYQALGIESLLAASDPRLKEFQSALRTIEPELVLKNGATYDRGIKGLTWAGERGFRVLVPQASGANRRFLSPLARKPAEPYGKAAADALKANPEITATVGKPLVSIKTGPEHALRKTHMLQGEFDVSDPATIKNLQLSFTAVKKMKVQLNGTIILDSTMEAFDPQPVQILLKPITRELLKPGKNTLTIDLEPGANGCVVSLNG